MSPSALLDRPKETRISTRSCFCCDTMIIAFRVLTTIHRVSLCSLQTSLAIPKPWHMYARPFSHVHVESYHARKRSPRPADAPLNFPQGCQAMNASRKIILGLTYHIPNITNRTNRSPQNYLKLHTIFYIEVRGTRANISTTKPAI
jgi:hypothetical protein